MINFDNIFYLFEVNNQNPVLLIGTKIDEIEKRHKKTFGKINHKNVVETLSNINKGKIYKNQIILFT